MLTAIVFQTTEGKCLAPHAFLSDPAQADLIRTAVSAQYADVGIKPLWLLDRQSYQLWQTGEYFSEIDSRILYWVDQEADVWLLCRKSSMQNLLPLIDRLLVIPLLPHKPALKPDIDSRLAELDNLEAAGFSAGNASGQCISTSAIIWQRIPAADLLLEIMANGDCDLHLHTNKSDGTDTPEQMVDRVLNNNLKAFAITDHDNLAALAPARSWLEQRCPDEQLRPLFIPGVELSIEEDREIHLLGYFPRGGTEVIETFLAHQRENRRERNEKMIRQLQNLGYPIDYEDFAATGEGTIGRLQAAVLLRDRGHFPTISAAFDELLGYGRPAYFERPRPTPSEAIWLIRKAGGVAVLAHPGLYGWCSGKPIVSDQLLAHLESLQQDGLQGVEAFHGEAPGNIQLEISAAALALGLIRTGGSDDHGINKAHAHLFPSGTHWLAESEVLVTAALINGPEKYGEPTWLLARRSTPGSGYGFWEFPGGKIEPGEKPAATLARELAEELNVGSIIGDRVLVLTFAYPEKRVVLIGLSACLESEDWQLTAHDAICYATAREALDMNLLPADVLFFETLIQSSAIS